MKPVTPPTSTRTDRPTRRRIRRGCPNRTSWTTAVLATTAAFLASLMLGPSAASAAPLQPAPTLSAVRTELDAALNDVVAAGVPGIIV